MYQVFSQVSVNWFYWNLCQSPEFLSQYYDSPAENSRSLPGQYKIGLQCLHSCTWLLSYTPDVDLSAQVSAGIFCPLLATGSTCPCREMKRSKWSRNHSSLPTVSCCAQGLKFTMVCCQLDYSVTSHFTALTFSQPAACSPAPQWAAQ